MSDNVIILGAGASYDAGIPLLGNFIDKMIELAATGRGPRGPLSEDEKSILKEALEIRNTIENYHARVTIDQFNLEQILSVLVFETQIGKKNSKQDLTKFTRAIATTIELTCNVLHDGNLERIQSEGNSIYQAFWLRLFNLYPQRLESIPTILSFNYDLVLERALLQAIIGHKYEETWRKANIDGIEIGLNSENSIKNKFKLKRQMFEKHVDRGGDYHFERMPGYILDDNANSEFSNLVRLNLLKLHGSLNYSKDKSPEINSLVTSSKNAAIIPPVFNKSDSNFASPIWKNALEALRNCKNIIICGYSLPTSDTYMQYFLKAALGPNIALNKIYIFDPALYSEGDQGSALRQRYRECFSSQFHKRIEFQPPGKKHPNAEDGTFAHMVSMFGADPEQILFGLKPNEKTSSHF